MMDMIYIYIHMLSRNVLRTGHNSFGEELFCLGMRNYIFRGYRLNYVRLNVYFVFPHNMIMICITYRKREREKVT